MTSAVTPEAIAAIEKLVESKRTPMEVKLTKNPRKAYIYINGEREEIDLPAPLRDMVAAGVSDLAEIALDETISEAPEIFVDAGAGKSVTLFCDRNERRETATLILEYTEQFKTVRDLSRDQGLTPDRLRRFIRFNLPGESTKFLVSALERVDFKRDGQSHTASKHGSESVGKSINAAAVGIDDVPQDFIVQIPVFRNEGVRNIIANIRVGVHIDSQQGLIALEPLADEIQNAVQFTAVELNKMIRGIVGERIPVFCGRNSGSDD